MCQQTMTNIIQGAQAPAGTPRHHCLQTLCMCSRGGLRSSRRRLLPDGRWDSSIAADRRAVIHHPPSSLRQTHAFADRDTAETLQDPPPPPKEDTAHLTTLSVTRSQVKTFFCGLFVPLLTESVFKIDYLRGGWPRQSIPTLITISLEMTMPGNIYPRCRCCEELRINGPHSALIHFDLK